MPSLRHRQAGPVPLTNRYKHGWKNQPNHTNQKNSVLALWPSSPDESPLFEKRTYINSFVALVCRCTCCVTACLFDEQTKRFERNQRFRLAAYNQRTISWLILKNCALISVSLSATAILRKLRNGEGLIYCIPKVQ